VCVCVCVFADADRVSIVYTGIMMGGESAQP
jgi:hypothetical protein